MAVTASCPLSGLSPIDGASTAALEAGLPMANILVATSLQAIRSYLRQGLEADQHTVYEAGSIDEVIDQLSEHRFDVVVADIFQPVLEGIALFSTTMRASPKTRLIALMDFQSARAKNYDLSLWVDSVITKPFTVERVKSEVEFMLGLAQRRRAAPALA